MSTSIGKMNLSLTASSREFASDMRRSAKEVKDFAAAGKAHAASFAKSMNSAVAGISAVAVASTTLRYAINQVRDSARIVEDIGDLSTMIGSSVEKTNALRLAGEKMGTGWDKSTGAITKMIEALGTSQGRNAFSNLGINPDVARAQDAVKTFTQLSDSINALPTAAQRVASMKAIFGKSWREIAEVVGEGGKAIRDAERQLESLGLTLTRVDTQAVDRSNSAWRELSGSIKSEWNKLAADISPLTEGIASSLKLALPHLITFARHSNAIGRTVSAAQAIGKEVNKRRTDLGGDIFDAADLAKRIDETTSGFKAAMEQLSKWGQRGKQIAEEVLTPTERYKKSIAELNELLRAGAIDQQTYGRAARQAANAVLEGSKLAEGLGKAVKEREGQRALAESIRTENLTPDETFLSQIKQINALREQGLITEETYARAAARYNEELRSAANTLRDMHGGEGRQVRLRYMAFNTPWQYAQQQAAYNSGGGGRSKVVVESPAYQLMIQILQRIEQNGRYPQPAVVS